MSEQWHYEQKGESYIKVDTLHKIRTLESELAAVTEQRDRLAEALDNTLKHMTHSLNCNTRIAESLSCNCRMERDYDNATKALQHIIQPSEFESYKNINLNKWKPIETAPKDGTRIIGCDGLNYYVCSWGEESLVGSESENHGWVTDYDDDGMCFNLESPTHWIPIVPFQKLLQSLNQPTP